MRGASLEISSHTQHTNIEIWQRRVNSHYKHVIKKIRMAKKSHRKKCFIHEINGKNDNNVGMNNGRARDGRRRGRKRRNMNQRRKRTNQIENYTTRTTCTTQCKNKHTSKKTMMFLARKTGVLHEYRNFGPTQKQPLARQNITGVPDGLMCGGKKRHIAKEFQKSTLGNESCAIVKKWCKNTLFDLSEIFFHKNFNSGKCKSKKKENTVKKWRKNRQKCSRNTRKRAKNGKTREKSRHFIFRSPFAIHLSIDSNSVIFPSSFSHPQPPSHATRHASPLPHQLGCFFPPIEITRLAALPAAR